VEVRIARLANFLFKFFDDKSNPKTEEACADLRALRATAFPFSYRRLQPSYRSSISTQYRAHGWTTCVRREARYYRPRAEILSGAWTFPKPQPID